MTTRHSEAVRSLHLFKVLCDSHKHYLRHMFYCDNVIKYKNYPKLKLTKVLQLIDLVLLNGTVDEEYIEQYIFIFYPELFTKHNKSSTIRLISDYIPYAIHKLLTT